MQVRFLSDLSCWGEERGELKHEKQKPRNVWAVRSADASAQPKPTYFGGSGGAGRKRAKLAARWMETKGAAGGRARSQRRRKFSNNGGGGRAGAASGDVTGNSGGGRRAGELTWVTLGAVLEARAASGDVT